MRPFSLSRFYSFFSSSTPSSTEKKSLLPQPTASAPSSPPVLDKLGRIRRNDAFLEQDLGVDVDTRALASQCLQDTLNALLDGTPPVLQVTHDGSGTHYSVRLNDQQDVDHLERLGLFLCEHRQRSALFLLATTVLQLNDPDHPSMRALMRACGQAVQQASTPIPQSLLEALQRLACALAQKTQLSSSELALFIPDNQQQPKHHPGFDTLLKQLGASEQQRQQALDRSGLCTSFDTLQSEDPPTLTVLNEGTGLHCLVPPGDAHGQGFDQLAGFARELQSLGIPGAANLFAALSLAARGQSDKEILLIQSCGRALLTGTGALPHPVLSQLCARVGELVATQALPPDWLQTFEWVAKQHQAHDCLAALRLRAIDLDIQRACELGLPAPLVSGLKSRIQAVHCLMDEHGLDGSAAVALMQTLRQAGGEDAEATTAQRVLHDMLRAPPSWLPPLDPSSIDETVRQVRSRADAATPERHQRRLEQLLRHLDRLAADAQPSWPEIECQARFALHAFSDGFPWTTSQRQRLVTVLLRLPLPSRIERLKEYLEQGPLRAGTSGQQASLRGLLFGLSQLAKGTNARAVLAQVMHMLDDPHGIADVPEWRPLVHALLIAYLGQPPSEDRLHSPELMRFIADCAVAPGEPTATFKAYVELASVLRSSLQGGEPQGTHRGKHSLVDLFGQALSDGKRSDDKPLRRPDELIQLRAAWLTLATPRNPQVSD